MDGAMSTKVKQKKLIHKSLAQFVTCVSMLLTIAAPAFHWLTKSFYAEDVADLVQAMQGGHGVPPLDFEADIVKGTMLQFGLIAFILGIALVVTMQAISARLWRPFDKTLEAIEAFRLESGSCPQLPRCDVEEFTRLNNALSQLMLNNLASYRLQKEFAENASHEMQTPLAVFRSKLDMLLQDPNLTMEQAAVIQDLYDMCARLSKMSRGLLLLAKIDNRQYAATEALDLKAFIQRQLPYYESLCVEKNLIITFSSHDVQCMVKANRTLLESLVSNLVVNAMRHNRANGKITITVADGSLGIANTSAEPMLDASRVFNRFYRPVPSDSGNGLGLAIAKAVCDYHGWDIAYSFNAESMTHKFTIALNRNRSKSPKR